MVSRRIRHDDPYKRYRAAYWCCRAAITERARAAAELGQGLGVAESLDLLRAQLHREVDHLIDLAIAEALIPAQVRRTSGPGARASGDR